MKKERCLILFVKYPENGKVKSRLAQAWNASLVAELYANFVRDMIATLEKGSFSFRIYFDPPEKNAAIKKICGEEHSYAAQNGADLGCRMQNAFLQEFAGGFNQVVLIGSDCPDLPLTIVEKAFRVLENETGCAIGPSVDGGYYLIGFRKDSFCPDIFYGPEWGSANVFQTTVNILQSRQQPYTLLPSWRDVDTSADLMDLIERNKETPFACSRTIKFLQDNP